MKGLALWWWGLTHFQETFPMQAPDTSSAWDNPMGTDGFEFIEYAAPDPAAMGAVFERMGFRAVARHRHKNVLLYRQGEINFILNAEPDSFAQRFARLHGPSVCAIAFRVHDAKAAYERALNLGAWGYAGQAGPGELNIPAIKGIGDSLTMTVEAGAIGGVPLGGVRFGASVNAEAYMDQATQFDFYDGGGLDLTCLGLAECDKEGNINVSKFGTRIAGCGGFVNITQNTKNVVFCGTFTTGKLREEIKDGELHILQEGKVKKFVPEVGHITFSGNYARKHKQHVLYITERAVFEMKEDGVHLTEIAPGIDLQKDVLDQMGFTPIIDEVKVMPAFLFEDKPMGLKKMKEEMNK